MQKSPALLAYYLITAISSCLFALVFTYSAIYRVEVVNLNPLQLILVGTSLEAAVFLFEIPTGVVADVYSRKLSVIIGYFLIGLGFILEGSLPFFYTVILAQLIWGIGYTFTSGAVSAWISDELQIQDMSKIFLRGMQMGQLGALLGIIASMVLVSLGLRIPLQVGGILFIALSLALIIVMPEHGFRLQEQRTGTALTQMCNTLREGLGVARSRPVLYYLLAIGLFYGLASEGLDRLWELHFLTNTSLPQITLPLFGDLDPVTWFGFIAIGALILSILAGEILKRNLGEVNGFVLGRLLLSMHLFLIAGILLFGYADSFSLALAGYWTIVLLRNTTEPLYGAWINRNLESRYRATGLSIVEQMNSLGQMVGGPIIGLIALSYSVRSSFIYTGILLVPVIFLLLPTFIKHRTRESTHF